MTRILMVEDDPLIGQIVCDMLVNKGYDVDWQKHGGCAAQSIKENRYGLAVLDSNLPQLSGLELLKLIRAQDKTLPVIILTAQSIHGHQQNYMEAGANAYIVKPFNFDVFLEKIEWLLAA